MGLFHLKLTGQQTEALVKALSEKFAQNELRRLTRFKLDVDYDDVVPANSTKPDAVFEIVEYADRRDQIQKLVEGARGLNPALPELRQIFELAGVDVVLPADRLELQRVVSQRSVFQDPALFRDRLSLYETWVCRVEIPGGGGTGLLVHEDLVLTNHHVMAPIYRGEVSRDNVTFRFDYKALPGGAELIGETRCGLAAGNTWDVAKSPPSKQDEIVNGAEPDAKEMDFALVRLAERAGRLPIGSKDPDAPPRSWFKLAPPPAIVATDPLFVLQYPSNLRLQLAVGSVLSFTAGGTRLRHNARTLGGSSGSPCFDANLALVAIHHAGDPDFTPGRAATYNQAVPLGRILGLLKQQAGLPSFWEENPP